MSEITNESTKKVVRGKRYTAEEKAEVVSFVEEHNAKNGRGGQTAAAAKFNISALTVSNWLKKAGSGSKKGSAASSSDSKGNLQITLNKMLSLGKEIDKLEKETELKRKKFNTLKKSLG